jgi:hypothetical protein
MAAWILGQFLDTRIARMAVQAPGFPVSASRVTIARDAAKA